MPSLFKIPVTSIKGVGARKAEYFHKLGIHTAGELIRFYPRTYEDWSSPLKIADALQNKNCCVKAKIFKALQPSVIRSNLVIYKLEVTDGEERMLVTFFNQSYLYEKLRSGGEFLFYGTVKYNGYSLEMTSPSVLETGDMYIHPIYPQTAGLNTKNIEKAVRQALSMLPEKINDPVPEPIRKEYDLCGLGYAVRNIHFPENMAALETAKKRLVFDELLVLQLGMARLKGDRLETTAHQIKKDYSKEFWSLLPFKPTNAQKRAVKDCIGDMKNNSYPMNRLVQGDVGSGKTAVAAAVCYTAVKNGSQCAFMAPTEILAEQHFRTLSKIFESTDVKVGLLTGSMKTSMKNAVREEIKSGSLDIVIGTHALISDNVEFFSLGLAVTDEQHRFGVGQRAKLIAKGENPHILVMSATPIPRTLALMIFGDLDLSVLDEFPPGRQKIDTFLIDSSKRQRAYGFLKKHIDNGQQCYIVCPLVEQNDEIPLISAEEYYKSLDKTILKDYKKAVLHGKMKAAEKDRIMREFSDGDIDIVIATTVIEVGVDVPNSTVMMIENAERFGLSQLHQLRGRVGRGKCKSYCILVSDNQKESTIERLKVMCDTNDGFKIADEDLKQRGPGEFFGAKQHGLPELKIAALSNVEVMEEAQKAADKILESDPTLSLDQHRGLNFETKRLFASVGSTERLQ